MKNRIFRYLSAFCSIVIALSSLTYSAVSADEPVGRMSSLYAYVLNDYIFTYGTLRTEEKGGTFYFTEDDEQPSGVVYGEIVNFDANENPYLVIFFEDGEYATAACHVWKYNEEKDRAERIAVLGANYGRFEDGQVGTFALGYFNDKRYIIYKQYENDIMTKSEYYTAIDGDAFQYVNTPLVAEETGVMDFSNRYFHPGVDVSSYNIELNMFFDKLKNTAADSVTYEDISERLGSGDEAQIEEVLKTVTGFTDFDIANYSTMDGYKEALKSMPEGDRFYLISEAYSLGDEIYYIRFSTDRSYYNYALLRRSDDADNGYQILKVRTDCIPLSDRELKQIKTDYDRNTLLYKKTKDKLKLEKRPSSDRGGDNAEEGNKDSAAKKKKEPLIHIDKAFDGESRLPVICIGGGVAIALLTILWVYLYSDND